MNRKTKDGILKKEEIDATFKKKETCRLKDCYSIAKIRNYEI